MIGILGSTGFLGHSLVKTLQQAGRAFVGGSRRTGVDGTNLSSLLKWIENNNIDCLVNLAAHSGGIGLNQKKPAELWLETSKIIIATMEAARAAELDKVVQVGTVCSYARNCELPFKERHLMHFGFPEPTNAAYGVAKLNGLFGCQSFHQQYGIKACYVVPVNLYGPHDDFDEQTGHVIPTMIRRFIEAKNNKTPRVECWGTGQATREFLYVDDASRAIVAAIDRIDEPYPINIGTGQEIRIRNLAEKIADLCGYEGQIAWDDSKPDGQKRRRLDISRAKESLGWWPVVGLDEGLVRTIQWYRGQ